MRAERPDIVLLDYVQPTKWSNWARYVVNREWESDHPTTAWAEKDALVPLTQEYRAACAASVKEWLDRTGLDGVQIDTPFLVNADNSPLDGVRLCAEVANAIAPRIMVPNFGDGLTWARRIPALRDAAGALGHLAGVHYVQMGVNLQRDDAVAYWMDRLRPEVEARLMSGKKIILGLYDEGRQREALGAAIMQSFNAPSLFWNYYTAVAPAPSAPSRSFNWNETFARLQGIPS